MVHGGNCAVNRIGKLQTVNIWLITSIVMNPSVAPRASSIQNARTAMALAELGHNVLLWHSSFKNQSRGRQCHTWFNQNFGTEPPPRLHFLAYTPRGERLDKKTPFFGAFSQITNLMRARFSPVPAPDAIVTRSPLILEQLRGGPVARLLLKRARLVLEWQYPESVQLWRGWRRVYPTATMREQVDMLRELRRKELARLPYADAILYAARGHERFLREAKFNGPALMFPSACLSPADSAPTAAPEFDFGYSGGITPDNGVELAIEALARLGSGRLLLLGPGSTIYIDRLRRRVAELNLADRVYFAGSVKPAEVRERLRRCRVGLVPISRRRGREKRQFASPLKLIEWLAAGVPAIASNVPSVSGLIRDEAIIVPADDAAALATAMERLINDEPLRRRLANSGLARAQTLTFPNRAERIVAMV